MPHYYILPPHADDSILWREVAFCFRSSRTWLILASHHGRSFRAGQACRFIITLLLRGCCITGVSMPFDKDYLFLSNLLTFEALLYQRIAAYAHTFRVCALILWICIDYCFRYKFLVAPAVFLSPLPFDIYTYFYHFYWWQYFFLRYDIDDYTCLALRPALLERARDWRPRHFFISTSWAFAWKISLHITESIFLRHGSLDWCHAWYSSFRIFIYIICLASASASPPSRATKQ